MSGFSLFVLTVVLLGWQYVLGTVGGLFRTLSDGSSKTIMQIVVSLSILATAIYVILSHSFDPQDKHWAYASAGTILGFWLKR